MHGTFIQQRLNTKFKSKEQWRLSRRVRLSDDRLKMMLYFFSSIFFSSFIQSELSVSQLVNIFFLKQDKIFPVNKMKVHKLFRF